jgi:hypothetical protein
MALANATPAQMRGIALSDEYDMVFTTSLKGAWRRTASPPSTHGRVIKRHSASKSIKSVSIHFEKIQAFLDIHFGHRARMERHRP